MRQAKLQKLFPNPQLFVTDGNARRGRARTEEEEDDRNEHLINLSKNWSYLFALITV